MRHLFVTNDFPPKFGGIESLISTLCKGFDPANVCVIAPSRAGHESVDGQLPYEVVRLPGTYLRGSGADHRGIAATVERWDPDVVHFLAALPLGRFGSRLRDTTGKPFTVFAHGSGEILVPARLPFARRALRTVLRSADLVSCVSEFTREAVDAVTRGQARTHVLPAAVDIERFSLEVSGAPVRERLRLGSRFTVLFVSRLVKRKGADLLVRAVAALKGTMAVIVGDGPERRSLERLIAEAGASDRIILAGKVSAAELPGYYAAADVFCMPCTTRFGGLDTEGFGIVYIEAQAAGLPCIAGNCGGSSEAVEDGVSGILLDNPTPRSIALTIRELQKDPARCALMGGAGRERAERYFAPRAVAAKLEAALTDSVLRSA